MAKKQNETPKPQDALEAAKLSAPPPPEPPAPVPEVQLFEPTGEPPEPVPPPKPKFRVVTGGYVSTGSGGLIKLNPNDIISEEIYGPQAYDRIRTSNLALVEEA